MKYSDLFVNKKLHVFIADDDIDDIQFFREAVEYFSKDIRITVASDGLELIEFLQITTPDIIFLDINMPCMSGIECLTEIRKLKMYDTIPVIVYSTSMNPAQIEKTRELGASMFCQKPAEFETIKNRIAEILARPAKDLLHQLPLDEYVIRA